MIFSFSDNFAQMMERDKGKMKAIVNSRNLTAFIFGLFIFGPAANYWYSVMFKYLPSTALVPTLIKASLGKSRLHLILFNTIICLKATTGQLFFGPAFTGVFFMIQSGSFSLRVRGWFEQTQKDLPTVWIKSIGFWLPVSCISFRVIAEHWIPLFTNMCSFVWTISLSL